MNVKRLPWLFLVVGIALKATLILFWRVSHIPAILKLLVHYDPGARQFAEEMTQLFFYHRGFTFAPGASISFEVFLAIGFGIECLVLGFVVQWVLRRFGAPRNAPSMPMTP